MSYFRYFAINQQGRRQRGVLAAAHEADLTQRLAAMGLDLITASTVHPRTHRILTRHELITLFVHLTHVSRAGVALLDGLRDLRDSVSHPVMREVVATLLVDLESGSALSEAMAKQPKNFGALIVNLIRVGETAGALVAVLAHLTDSLKQQDELRVQTQRILLYPSLVLLMVGGVMVMLLLFLVPQIVQLMHGMNMAVPMSTLIMLELSKLIRADWWLILVGTGLSVGSLLVLHHHQTRFRFWCDSWKLRLPLVGEILKKIDLARFANIFALMYRSGVPIFDGLALSADLVQNRVLAMSIRRSRDSIVNGERLSAAFMHEQIFPALVLSMLRVGETTGALDGALLEVSYFYQRDVREAINRLLTLLEPALTLLLGAVLAIIIGMVLLPLYDVLGTVRL
ncbi:type II secretion system F family protein [Sulfuriferula nivalis]|uniref:Type II secretion system protein F n=1 Tax=Sulfuriferula nivalis TaxID=2675298 RepID=A0A809SB99_9PROT|nr:type II secretion system F family protein [Sulfuriferula nivalis]BBP02152.1 type II secretion system protein F [Sulfuriferula nivalis]